MNKLQTSQSISKYSDSITLKMPHIRKPLTLFSLYAMNDSQIDILYENINSIGLYNAKKQNILDALCNHYDSKVLFKDMLKAGDELQSLVMESIEYMYKLASKEYYKSNASAKDINSYRRLYIIRYILWTAHVWRVLEGEVTNTYNLISEYKIDEDLLTLKATL